MANNDVAIRLKVDAETGDLIATRKEFGKLTKSTKKTKSELESFTDCVSNLAYTSVALYAVKQAFDGIFQAVGSLVSVSAKFEKFETTLTTLEGSSKKAKESMSWIQDFATKTPYEIDQVTESFVKLKAYGINPTNGTLKTLGDTASAMGKPMMQAVEAMADALTGENERLKEFGIKASVNGDKIAYNWMDASNKAKHIVIENNAEIIQSTLSAIFNSKYENAMQMQMSTYDGMLSNLRDQWTRFKFSIMDNGLFEYVKAIVTVISKRLSEAFSVAAKNSITFTNKMITGLNSTIESFGFLYDAINGIKLVLRGIELGFHYMVKGIASAMNTSTELVNGFIETYNSAADLMGLEKMAKYELRDVGFVDNQIEDTKKQIDDLVGSLTKGRVFTKGLVQDINTAFTSISNQKDIVAPKTDVVGAEDGNIRLKGSNSTSSQITVSEIQKENQKIAQEKATFLQSQKNAYLNYYQTIGDYAKAWELKEEEIRKKNTYLTQTELDKMVKIQKKDYFDELKKETKELSYVFTNAFKGMEDSLVNFVKTGKLDFKGLADSIITDMTRMAIQQSITKPLVGAVGGFFGFADGGIMSGDGAVPLKAYASGGIATSPQLALFGEGSMNEAYVPLPDGRSIPVTMKGGSAGNTYINITNESGTPVDMKILSETLSQDGDKTIAVVMNAIERNPDMRNAIKGVR